MFDICMYISVYVRASDTDRNERRYLAALLLPLSSRLLCWARRGYGVLLLLLFILDLDLDFGFERNECKVGR